MRSKIQKKTIHFVAQRQLKSAQKIFMREMFRSPRGLSALLDKASEATDTSGTSDSKDSIDTQKRLYAYFIQPAHLIQRFLDRWELYPDEEEAFTQYFLMMSLMQERVDELIKSLDLEREDMHRHFKSIELVRCWAQFIKYPKAFKYVPYPEYYMESCGSLAEMHPEEHVLTIDSEFIKTFYAQDELIPDEAIARILSKYKVIKVEIPDLVLLTSQITKAMKKLIRLLSLSEKHKNTLTSQQLFIGAL